MECDCERVGFTLAFGASRQREGWHPASPGNPRGSRLRSVEEVPCKNLRMVHQSWLVNLREILLESTCLLSLLVTSPCRQRCKAFPAFQAATCWSGLVTTEKARRVAASAPLWWLGNLWPMAFQSRGRFLGTFWSLKVFFGRPQMEDKASEWLLHLVCLSSDKLESCSFTSCCISWKAFELMWRTEANNTSSTIIGQLLMGIPQKYPIENHHFQKT